MTVTFRLKPQEIEAVQWSGSNWHEMLEAFGKDVVSTNGRDLFVHFPDKPETFLLHRGEWLSTSLQVFDDAGLTSRWDRVED